jgi:hypothetical protein
VGYGLLQYIFGLPARPRILRVPCVGDVRRAAKLKMLSIVKTQQNFVG